MKQIQILFVALLCLLFTLPVVAEEGQQVERSRVRQETRQEARAERQARRWWFARREADSLRTDRVDTLLQPSRAEKREAKQLKQGEALMHLTLTSHNFGDVPRKGGDLVYDFPFTNEGMVPLVVTRVITSCSCLKASYPKRPVAPGATGVIRITYEPHKSEAGVFNKVIQVYSNSSSDRELITVQGNSIGEKR